MATKPWALGLIILTTALTSTAQVFLKTGSARLPELFTNLPLLAGAGLYVLGAGMMILAFRGGEVTILYPVFATSYIWVTLLSASLFGESIHSLRWLGIASIILGISLIAFGSNHKVKDPIIEYVEVP